MFKYLLSEHHQKTSFSAIFTLEIENTLKKLTLILTLLVATTLTALAEKPKKVKYYANGNASAEFYSIGKRAYRVVFYYEDGNVRETGFFKDGKLHGHWVSYYEDGAVRAEANFLLNRKLGTWHFWQASGESLGSIEYEY